MLTKKGDDEPSRLIDIDNDMRDALGEPADDSEFLAEWYNYVGFRLAVGRTWEQVAESVERDIRSATKNEDGWPQDVVDDYLALCLLRRRIVEWLAENYTSSAWAVR